MNAATNDVLGMLSAALMGDETARAALMDALKEVGEDKAAVKLEKYLTWPDKIRCDYDSARREMRDLEQMGLDSSDDYAKHEMAAAQSYLEYMDEMPEPMTCNSCRFHGTNVIDKLDEEGMESVGQYCEDCWPGEEE